jgi:hypothetical protein
VTSTTTLPEDTDLRDVRRARNVRRVGLLALAAFVLAGAVGLLGTRTTTTSARGGGYELTVTYPAVTRSGHAVKVEVEVRKDGGFDPDEPVRMRLLSRYFDLFDENAFTPQPDAETADGVWTYEEFVPPRGEVFTVSVDTRVEPAKNTGERGEVALVDEQGRPFLSVSFRTRLMP